MTPTTAVRGSVGIMYDQPILGGYEQALQLSGSPKAPAYTFNGAAAGAPAFPGQARRPARWRSSRRGPCRPDFQVARTKQTNVQLEQAFGRDFTASVGFIYANGDNLPVVTDVNLGNADRHAGRWPADLQCYGASRVDPRFNRIFEVQSVGDSTFKGADAAGVEAPGAGPDLQRPVRRPARASTTRRC